MPLRVRCRCGQELVLRYSEWVYLLLGLLLVAVLANSAAVLLLYIELQSRDAGGDPVPGATLETPSTKTKARARAAGAPDPAAAQAASAAPENTVPVSTPPPERHSKSAAVVALEPRRDTAGEAEVEAARREASSRAAGLAEVAVGETSTASSRTAPPEASGDGAAGAAQDGTSSSIHRQVIDVPRLLRLYLLSSSSGAPLLTAAFLVDPDPRLRRLALDEALRQPPSSLEEQRLMLALLHESSSELRRQQDGRELLRRLTARRTEPPPTAPPPAATWKQLEVEATSRLSTLPGKEALLHRLTGFRDGGVDILIAVDTTQSMKSGLVTFQQAAAWLLPAIEWAVEGSRLALLCFRDEVVQAYDFTETPSEDILPAILALEAEGGAPDVAEGVHAAFRAALELGRFNWREEAAKHIFLIGDQPPRWADRRPFMSLAAAAHREGGYTLHLLGVTPRDGIDISYYGELAEQGGGRSVTCTAENLDLEIMLCLFGEDRRSTVVALRPLLHRLFTGS